MHKDLREPHANEVFFRVGKVGGTGGAAPSVSADRAHGKSITFYHYCIARAQQALFQEGAGLPLSEDELVFSHYDGKSLLPNSITHAWKSLAKRTGLKGIRLHDARHTHASIMLKQGVHPKIVQERLGHGSIQITLDTYSHVAPGLQQAAAKGFDDILLPQKQIVKPD